MKLGLGLGIAYLAANQTAGEGEEEPPALYGLSDDGESLWSLVGPVGLDENSLWVDEGAAYKLNDSSLWEAV